jgi:hypothetical protein
LVRMSHSSLDRDQAGLDEVVCMLDLHIIVFLRAGVGSFLLLDIGECSLGVIEDVGGRGRQDPQHKEHLPHVKCLVDGVGDHVQLSLCGTESDELLGLDGPCDQAASKKNDVVEMDL